MTRPTPAQLVTSEVQCWLEVEDDLLPVIPLVVAVANSLSGPPVWLTMVAASSWGKSDLIMPIADLDGAYFLSCVTEKTFASGKKREDNDPKFLSLLERLKAEGKWLLAIKDLGTIQSLSSNKRNAIYGQLREIYDGAYRQSYGTGVEVDWQGKLGLIAAATNIIDDYSKWSLALGERFVYFRLRMPPRTRVALRAWTAVHNQTDSGRLDALAASYRGAFAEALRLSKILTGWSDPPADSILMCNTVAELVIDGRTPIDHDRYGDGYQVGDSEGPGRLMKVMAQLHRAAAICFGGDLTAAGQAVLRVGLDSIPRKRVMTLRELSQHPDGLTAGSLAKALRCDDNTAGRYLRDVKVLGLAESSKPANRWIFQPSQRLRNYASAIFSDEYDEPTALRKLFEVPSNFTPAREREEVGV